MRENVAEPWRASREGVVILAPMGDTTTDTRVRWSADAQLDLALIELARMSREIEVLRVQARDDRDWAHLASLEAVRDTLASMVVRRLEVQA